MPGLSRPCSKGSWIPSGKKTPGFRSQLVEINNQKGAAEAQLGEVEKQNTGLAAGTKELKSAQERVAQLEAAVSERDKKLIQFEQKFGELEKALAKEKAEKDQMGVELSPVRPRSRTSRNGSRRPDPPS